MSTIKVELCDNKSNIEELHSQYKEFISKISHEIRNPLTLIYSSFQLLESEIPSISDSDLCPQIKKDIQDTICLLKDISSLNRNSSTRKAPFSVSDFLSGNARSFQAMAREKNISFVTDFDHTICDLTFCGDEQLLKEALLNLLLNAADALSASSTGSVNTFIILTATVCDSCLIIHVRDNGPGIPQEYLPTLFEPFVTHKKHGTGLGLSIAHHAAEEHGGTLTVETNCQGSCTYTDFCLKLPAQNALRHDSLT